MPKIKFAVIILLIILPTLACGDGGDDDTQATGDYPNYHLENLADVTYPTASPPIGEAE